MRRLIVAITGASGAMYGIRALELLKTSPDVETHLIISSAGAQTITQETAFSIKDVRALAHYVYHYHDMGASLSSGSFSTDGMLVAPCSVRTLSGIASCFDSDLIVRAADVCLKERRRVVLLFRETPLHAGHIALMAQASENGAILMPPVPAFYSAPHTIEDIVTQSVGRALEILGFETPVVKHWEGGASAAVPSPVATGKHAPEG